MQEDTRDRPLCGGTGTLVSCADVGPGARAHPHRPTHDEDNRRLLRRLPQRALALGVRHAARTVRYHANRREPGAVVASLSPASGGRDAAGRRTTPGSRNGQRHTPLHRAGPGRTDDGAHRHQRPRDRDAPRERCSGMTSPMRRSCKRPSAIDLSDRAALERQVQRMLADDRAHAFVSRFFFPWLQLDTLAKADPDKKYFPDYDVSLRDSLARETELFLLSQLRDDRDPIELWSANYSFLNEQLAKHYGVPNVTGSQFRRTPLPMPERAGLLGQGSVLMVTSRHEHGVDAAYTTPATRAKWVRLHFFGAPLPNGFPGAQPVKPELPITPQTRTLAVESMRQLSSRLLPAWLCAGELRPAGPLAHQRSDWPGRRVGRVRRWHANQRSDRPPPGPAAVPRGISHDAHREADHLRVSRRGGADECDARVTRTGPADSANHTESSLVRAHRGRRSMNQYTHFAKSACRSRPLACSTAR